MIELISLVLGQSESRNNDLRLSFQTADYLSHCQGRIMTNVDVIVIYETSNVKIITFSVKQRNLMLQNDLPQHLLLQIKFSISLSILSTCHTQ